MSSIFIADLHLDIHQPERINAFVQFLQQQIQLVDHIYILGDLFNFWAGKAQGKLKILNNLLELLLHPKISFLAGNRDFLFVEYLRKNHKQSLQDKDNIFIEPYNIMVAHGDCFLTNDKGYKLLKSILTSRPLFYASQIAPAFLCITVAMIIRYFSLRSKKNKIPTLKLNLDYAVDCMNEKNSNILICGHAHLGQKYSIQNKDIYILPECKGIDFHYCLLNNQEISFI